MKKINVYVITFGDVTNDGHGETCSFCIKSQFSKSEIEKCLDEIYSKTGFNFEEFCCDFEDRSINDEQIEILKNNGIEIDYDECKENGISVENFQNILFGLLNKVKPGIAMEIIDDKNIFIEKTWGYGLFL